MNLETFIQWRRSKGRGLAFVEGAAIDVSLLKVNGFDRV